MKNFTNNVEEYKELLLTPMEYERFKYLTHEWTHFRLDTQESVEFDTFCVRLYKAANPSPFVVLDYSQAGITPPEELLIHAGQERLNHIINTFCRDNGERGMWEYYLNFGREIYQTLLVTDYSFLFLRPDAQRANPKRYEILKKMIERRDHSYVHKEPSTRDKIEHTIVRGVRRDIKKWYDKMEGASMPADIYAEDLDANCPLMRKCLWNVLYLGSLSLSFNPRHIRKVNVVNVDDRLLKQVREAHVSSSFLDSKFLTVEAPASLFGRLLGLTTKRVNGSSRYRCKIYSRLTEICNEFREWNTDTGKYHKTDGLFGVHPFSSTYFGGGSIGCDSVVITPTEGMDYYDLREEAIFNDNGNPIRDMQEHELDPETRLMRKEGSQPDQTPLHEFYDHAMEEVGKGMSPIDELGEMFQDDEPEYVEEEEDEDVAEQIQTHVKAVKWDAIGAPDQEDNNWKQKSRSSKGIKPKYNPIYFQLQTGKADKRISQPVLLFLQGMIAEFAKNPNLRLHNALLIDAVREPLDKMGLIRTSVALGVDFEMIAKAQNELRSVIIKNCLIQDLSKVGWLKTVDMDNIGKEFDRDEKMQILRQKQRNAKGIE